MSDLVERLRKEYQDATFPTHNDLSVEPRYECAYCTEVELAPNCHVEKCLALLLSNAADRIEQLEAALQDCIDDHFEAPNIARAALDKDDE